MCATNIPRPENNLGEAAKTKLKPKQLSAAGKTENFLRRHMSTTKRRRQKNDRFFDSEKMVFFIFQYCRGWFVVG